MRQGQRLLHDSEWSECGMKINKEPESFLLLLREEVATEKAWVQYCP